MLESLALNGAALSSPGHVDADKKVVPTTSATFPAVLAIAIVPVASGVGKSAPLVVPPDSRTRKYLPGATLPVVRFVLELPKFDPTLPYWTEYGVTEKSTVVVPRL